MLRTIALVLFASSCYAAGPAVLHVQVHDAKYLTFKINNRYRSPITEYEVAVSFPGTPLACGLRSEVKGPADLHPSGVCGIPENTSTGKANGRGWKARIVFVRFADGMRWAPTE